MRKKITRIIALTTCVVTVATTTIFASTMKDVGTKHWAYSEIMEIQKRGLIVTNSQGEFFPNNYVTYFELSQILAKATGYQDELVNPNMNEQLKLAIRENYAKQKATIESYQKNYTYWQKDANEEIAYLLGKGYLKQEDLGKFMSKSTSGVESKRGVRKQEITAYLVRILQKEETAKKEYVSTGFSDESTIDATLRPHVAYCKKLGIISGNDKNQFGPSDPITRAILSKMLVDTLRIKEAGGVETTQTPTTQTPTTQTPTNTDVSETNNKGLEGKLTKMISKGDGGYYVVLEVEPGKVHTYSMESTAIVKDKSSASVSLTELKARIDNKDKQDVNVTVQVSLTGTTEYITNVQLMDTYTAPVVDNKETKTDKVETKEDEADDRVSTVKGSIYSILIAPTSEVTLQLSDGTRKRYEIGENADLYSTLTRRNISIWDLRLNQQVELEVASRQIKFLEITKAAPPLTYTGTITSTSTRGDQIEVYVAYDPLTQTKNFTKLIDVPMSTQILDGTIQRGRKDLKEDMQVVITYGENNIEPEQIIILSK